MFVKLKESVKNTKALFDSAPTLRIRLLFIIVSAVFVIVLMSTLLSLRYQRQQLIKSAQSAATTLSNAILANLQHAMLTVDRDMMNELAQAVVAGEAIESLRILDDQGFVQGERYRKRGWQTILRKMRRCACPVTLTTLHKEPITLNLRRRTAMNC